MTTRSGPARIQRGGASRYHPGNHKMRYTENERYYTAESTITWPLGPLIQQPPRFSLSSLSHGTRPLIDQTTAPSELHEPPNYNALPSSTLIADSHGRDYSRFYTRTIYSANSFNAMARALIITESTPRPRQQQAGRTAGSGEGKPRAGVLDPRTAPDTGIRVDSRAPPGRRPVVPAGSILRAWS